MKYYIARYYRDKNGTLQDVAIDWSYREPIDIDDRIDRGVVIYNAIYRGYRDLRDELFDLCNNSVRAYISENSDMTNAIPCEIYLIGYEELSDPFKYDWHFNITLYPDDKDRLQTFKSELNRKYGLLSMLRIKRIIIRDPATIVFWEDGTKTVVKLSWADTEDGKSDIYAGVAYAIAKKLFGSNSAFKKEVDRKAEDKTPVYKFEPITLGQNAELDGMVKSYFEKFLNGRKKEKSHE